VQAFFLSLQAPFFSLRRAFEFVTARKFLVYHCEKQSNEPAP
jgi:hypothetical protein